MNQQNTTAVEHIPTADYQWLVAGGDDRAWQIVEDDSLSLPQKLNRLRRIISRNQAHLVCQQQDLRSRAQTKFGDQARRMLFTPVLLEQATSIEIADYKASRFPKNRPIYDLCAGIGGDSIPLAGRGSIFPVDRDPIASLLCQHNLRVAGHSVTGIVADVQQVTLPADALWHLDPDRRSTGKRVSRIEQYSPPPEVIDRLLSTNSGAVKLAPAARPAESWRELEREWIGHQRECKQQILWSGELMRHPGRRAATIIGDQGAATIVGEAGDSSQSAEAIGAYVYEPHAAIYAANLTGALANELGLEMLADESGYLTGKTPLDDLRVATFEVEAVERYDMKRLRALISSYNVGRLEFKKRNADISIDVFKKKLKLRGEQAFTLLLGKHADANVAILARRLAGDGNQTLSHKT